MFEKIKKHYETGVWSEQRVRDAAVTEIYRKVVSVEAHNEREPHQRAWDAWNNTEIILDMDNFDGVEMYVLGEGQESCDGKIIEGYDEKGGATND